MPRERNNNPDLLRAPRFPQERPRPTPSLRDYSPIRDYESLARAYREAQAVRPYEDSVLESTEPPVSTIHFIGERSPRHHSFVSLRPLSGHRPGYTEVLHDGLDHVLLDEFDIEDAVREHNRLYRHGWDQVADGCSHPYRRDNKVHPHFLWGAGCTFCDRVELRVGSHDFESCSDIEKCPFCSTSDVCPSCGRKMTGTNLAVLTIEAVLEGLRQETRRVNATTGANIVFNTKVASTQAMVSSCADMPFSGIPRLTNIDWVYGSNR